MHVFNPSTGKQNQVDLSLSSRIARATQENPILKQKTLFQIERSGFFLFKTLNCLPLIIYYRINLQNYFTLIVLSNNAEVIDSNRKLSWPQVTLAQNTRVPLGTFQSTMLEKQPKF